MATALPRIWTQITMFITYDSKHYTKNSLYSWHSFIQTHTLIYIDTHTDWLFRWTTSIQLNLRDTSSWDRNPPSWLYVSWTIYPRAIVNLRVIEGDFCIYFSTYMLSATWSAQFSWEEFLHFSVGGSQQLYLLEFGLIWFGFRALQPL